MNFETEDVKENEEVNENNATETSEPEKETLSEESEEVNSDRTDDEEADAQSEESEAAGEENSDEETDVEEGDGKDESKIKNFFHKKKDKRDEQIADLNDRVKRQMAEFENFRKRSEKEKSRMYDMGASSMLEKIFPVVDSFERGLDAAPEEGSDAFADGMRMVYKQLMTALEQAGVTEIEALGKEFDPEIHNAVMHIDDENYGENEIVEVLQKGYKYHESVIRHSMVKVAN